MYQLSLFAAFKPYLLVSSIDSLINQLSPQSTFSSVNFLINQLSSCFHETYCKETKTLNLRLSLLPPHTRLGYCFFGFDFSVNEGNTLNPCLCQFTLYWQCYHTIPSLNLRTHQGNYVWLGSWDEARWGNNCKLVTSHPCLVWIIRKYHQFY